MANTKTILRVFRRWGFILVSIVVLGVLLSHAHEIDWAGAWKSLRRYPPTVLLEALAMAVLSHMLYGCFDLLGRRHTGHELPRWHTWCIGMASYAFTLNLGALLGGVATRVRLYARANLDEVTIAQLIALGATTNWMGYGVVAGTLFAAGAIAPPSRSHLTPGALQALGMAMILLALAYVAVCAMARGRTWQVRKRKIRLPAPGLALSQLLVSAGHWATMGAVMYLLLGMEVPYPIVLAVLMAAAIAGVVTPVPAGLGVLEAVFLALLSGTVPQGRLVAAVLAYRAVYYLVPLAGAVGIYFGLERYLSRRGGQDVARCGHCDPVSQPTARYLDDEGPAGAG